MKKALPIVGVLLILAGLLIQFAPSVLPAGQGVDEVVVLYESATPTPEDNAVFFGPTATALRVAGKWRQWDQDVLPENRAVALEAVIDSEGVPCLVLYRAGRLVYKGPLPATDSALVELIQQHGGILQ